MTMIVADGKIGSVVADHLGGRDPEDVLIWCAVKYDDPGASLLDFLEALSSTAWSRVVFCSSIRAAPHEYGYQESFSTYGAMKLSCEAHMRAWSASTGHPSVALRIGAYDDAITGPMRTTKAGILYWIDRALGEQSGHHVWAALG